MGLVFSSYLKVLGDPGTLSSLWKVTVRNGLYQWRHLHIFKMGGNGFGGENKQQKPLHTTGLGISGLGGGGEPVCLGFGLSLDRLHLIPDRTLFYFVCVVFFGSKHV